MTSTTIITGASSGIGYALAKLLHAQQHEVIGIARDFSRCDGLEMTQHAIDLGDIDDLPKRLAQFKFAPDLLVLNAGYGQFGGIEQFSHRQIRQLIDTNLVSHLFLLKHFLPMMKRQGGGDIIILGSESALRGARAGSVYCASKFALRGLAQSLRADTSSANIRVILINPGPVDSDFFDDLDFAPENGDDFSIDAESVAQIIVDTLAQPRNVVCEEINVQPIKRAFRKKK